MAPPQEQPDLNELFPGLFQGPQIDPTDPRTWPVPGNGGVSPVEHQREQMRQVVAAMRQDLGRLKYMLTALDGSCGDVGTWDVAQSLGTRVGTAHQNMVRSVQAYCRAYEAVINRIEHTAATYGKAEQAAETAGRHPTRHLGQPPSNDPSSPLPWRTR